MFAIFDQMRLLSASRFEQLCAQLLRSDQAILVDGKSGDRGVDLFRGPLDRKLRAASGEKLHVWQAKYFTAAVNKSRKQQIEGSLIRVCETYAPESWTLCVPINLDVATHEWVQELGTKHGIPVDVLQASDLERLILKDDAVRREYFLPAAQDILDVITNFSDFQPVASAIDRVREALAVQTHSGEEFYDGAAPDWRDIAQDFDARRDVMGDLWNFAIAALTSPSGRIPFAVVTGRSGEGKSTVLMRFAAELVRHGQKHVYFHHASSNELNPAQFASFPPGTRIFLFIDSITRFPPGVLLGFLTRLRHDCVQAIVVGAAIQSLWDGQEGAFDNVAAVDEFRLRRLSDHEIEAILEKLSADESYLGDLRKLTHDERVRLFRRAKGQLLVALLEAKRSGGNFESYVRGELNALEEHFGRDIRKACVYVSLVHRFDVRLPVPLLQRLLPATDLLLDVFPRTKKLLHISDDGLMSSMRHPLIAEVIASAQDDHVALYEKIITAAEPQDERILVRVLHALCSSSDPVHAARLLELASRRSLKSPMFPHIAATLAFKKRNIEAAREIFRRADDAGIADGRILASWATLEAADGNLGDLRNPAATSARGLFRRAIAIAPDEVPRVQYAIFERDQKNVGTIDDPHSARGILHEAYTRFPDGQSLVRTWAILENKLRNIGKSKECPWSARWLYARLSEIDPRNTATWRAWAIMEAGAKNLDGAMSPNARELFRKATEIEPNDAITWTAWAHAAANGGNLGDVNKPGTARWMFRHAIDLKPEMPHAWGAWSSIERHAKNFGAAGDPAPYTARWLYARVTALEPESPQGWCGWAMVERDCGNLGDREDPAPGTARWLFAKGVEVAEGDPESVDVVVILSEWTKLERKNGDASVTRDLFRRSFGRRPANAVNLFQWATFEYEQDNVGDAIDPDELTARWLFRESARCDPGQANVWATWARLENERGNVGSRLDPEIYTARWLVREGLKHAGRSSELNAIAGRIEAGQGQLEAAESYYAKAIRFQSVRNLKAQQCAMFAFFLRDATQHERAAAYLQLALFYAPRDVRNHTALAGEFFSLAAAAFFEPARARLEIVRRGLHHLSDARAIKSDESIDRLELRLRHLERDIIRKS